MRINLEDSYVLMITNDMIENRLVMGFADLDDFLFFKHNELCLLTDQSEGFWII
jgi:hypothetical protein